MGRWSLRRWAGATAATLVLASGCGTTVHSGRGRSSDSNPSGGLAASDAGSPAAGGGPANSLPGGGGGAGGGAAGASQAGAASRRVPGAGAGTGGPASQATRQASVVRLGVIYLKGLDAAYKSAGAKSATTDSQADYAAVVNDINVHGGIAGRRVLPFYYAIDAASATAPADQLQAACTHFTQDQPVDVVLSYTPGSGGVLVSCLRARRVPLVIGSNEADVSADSLSGSPMLWEPAEVSLDRLEQVLPRFLIGAHWADARWGSDPRCATVETRIGVVTFDQPDWRSAYTKNLAPEFEATGHKVYDVAFLSVSGNTANQLADASAAVQNAVLKFSTDCVDHVVFVSNVAVDYLFMNVAEQQQYAPRYGLSSLEAPPVIIQNLANPRTQLTGSIGVGWSPFSDVNIQDFDAAARAPGQRCMDVLKRAGLAPVDNNSSILAAPSCEGPYFAAAAFGRWLDSPPSNGLVDAVNGLGSSYQPTGTFSASFRATQHDGASAYRALTFVDSCTCYRYGSGLQPW